jgi:hypothetical protein
MFDTILLLVAFVCQLACGILGYTVSTRGAPDPKKRKRYEAAFVLMALIGGVAIFWSGYRSGDVQNEILAGISELEHPGGVSPSIADAKKIASLFNTIDPNIMNEIEQGNFDLTVRMQPTDLAQLRMILTADTSQPPLAVIENVGPPMFDDEISNGTLGPPGPVALQNTVKLHVDKKLAVDNAN